MKKLVVRYGKDFVNLRASTIKVENGMVFAYLNEELVGIFDLGIVDLIYLSEIKQ